MSFPFLFWGRRPADWFAGANDGHFYEVRFARALAAPERIEVAKVFRACTQKGSVRAADRDWYWSGAFALFCVGENRGADAFFDQLEKVLLAIHAVAPIAEVTFLGERERGTHPWDVWTASQAERPTPGPPWPHIVDRNHDPALAVGVVDAAFELARVGREPAVLPPDLPRVVATEVQPNVAGMQPTAANVAVPVSVPGTQRAARAGPHGTVVLTTEVIALVKDVLVAQFPSDDGRQLVVTAGGIAVTSDPQGVVRAYRVTASSIALVAIGQLKVTGTFYARGDRVFFAWGSRYFELAGW